MNIPSSVSYPRPLPRRPGVPSTLQTATPPTAPIAPDAGRPVRAQWGLLLGVFGMFGGFPLGSAIGAAVGGLFRGRIGAAVGAVIGNAICTLPVALLIFVFETSWMNRKQALMFAAPALASAGLAWLGFAIAGPTAALIGALAPSILVVGVEGFKALKERLSRPSNP